MSQGPDLDGKRPKDRKATIVAAAAELFAERGYAAVGIDDIGAAVGVSGPAIYRHFRGKGGVLAAVLTDAVEGVSAAARNCSGLAELMEATVAASLDRPATLATYVRERPRLEAAVLAEIATAERRLREVWRAVVVQARPDLDPAQLRIRWAAVLGALGAAMARPPGVARPRLDELLATSALAMMQAPVIEPSPGPPPQAWTPPAGKRDEILTAALQLVRERGFHGVGIDEIGQAAGISGPTVYHYYDSKADLLVDAYDRVGQRVAVGVEHALGTAGSANDALERLVRSYVSIAIDSLDLIVVTSREGFALPEAERPRLSRRRESLRDAWTAVLRELRPDLAEAEVRFLVRLAFSLVNNAAQASRGEEGSVDQIAALVECHLLSC